MHKLSTQPKKQVQKQKNFRKKPRRNISKNQQMRETDSQIPVKKTGHILNRVQRLNHKKNPQKPKELSPNDKQSTIPTKSKTK